MCPIQPQRLQRYTPWAKLGMVLPTRLATLRNLLLLPSGWRQGYQDKGGGDNGGSVGDGTTWVVLVVLVELTVGEMVEVDWVVVWAIREVMVTW